MISRYRKTLFDLGLAGLLCLGFMSCGGGGGGGDGDASVTDLRVSDRTLGLGESAVLTVDFSFSANAVFDDGANVIIAVKLPASVAFVEGSSEIQGIFGDDPIGAQGTVCASGETILVFELDGSDLDTADNPDGDADARLTLTYQGVSAVEADTIEARAEDLSFLINCEQPFLPEAIESIAVS